MARRPRSARTPRASGYVRERAAQEGTVLSRLRARLAERGLSPRRRLGQNFLFREDLCERIVEHCHLSDDDVAIEIGPGAGALTSMLAQRVRKLIAVERDTGLAELLREDLAEMSRVEVVETDFLKFDLTAAATANDAGKLMIVGNIPYNITTPVLERIFEHKHVIRTAVLLVQKEYAERLAAEAATPEYGSLTLFARYHALLEPLMTIRSSAFWPRPSVDSMLVRIFMRDQPPVDVPDEALLFRIIRGSFHMRRKQLMNTLEETLQIGKENITHLCRHARIDPKRRGETLTLEEFAKLTRVVANDVARE